MNPNKKLIRVLSKFNSIKLICSRREEHISLLKSDVYCNCVSRLKDNDVTDKNKISFLRREYSIN